ncbi:MAG TPA: C1 family peptidase, partial [Chitinophagaceae bacterium]|nr:C1 family peptidase [Chitinophagaceae bacterium]
IVTAARVDAQPAAEAYLPRIHLTDSAVFCPEVKDQSQSPTCWAFGSNSLFESDLAKKNNLRLNLSEMFIARYAYIDKARQWLATKGKTYYEGGGQFRDVIRIINKYGIVPEEVYDGRPNGEPNHNHARLDTAMKRFAQQLLLEGKTELNPIELGQMNDTLDRYLGKVPETFLYNLKPYNPKTFAKEIGLSGDDYVDVMSFANLPFNQKCLLADKFNWAGDSLYNITLDDMQMLVDTALAKGWSVGWEGDVTEPGFNYWAGYAISDYTPLQFTEQRSKNFKNESTERDHMLHLVGIGRDEKNNKWYYLKNSWGTWFSKYKGFLFMDETYFKLNTVIMMVNKQALPQSLKVKLGLGH